MSSGLMETRIQWWSHGIDRRGRGIPPKQGNAPHRKIWEFLLIYSRKCNSSPPPPPELPSITHPVLGAVKIPPGGKYLNLTLGNPGYFLVSPLHLWGEMTKTTPSPLHLSRYTTYLQHKITKQSYLPSSMICTPPFKSLPHKFVAVSTVSPYNVFLHTFLCVIVLIVTALIFLK